MNNLHLTLLDETKYNSDIHSVILFEDENSFSFARIQLEDCSLKFSWNSNGIKPGVLLLKEKSLVFIGVDIYIVGYNYKKKKIIFYLNTTTNFKWFDELRDGIVVVNETSIIIVNTMNRCTIRNCVFFGDIILDTAISGDSFKVSFLNIEDDSVKL